jgi:hypothetical protein
MIVRTIITLFLLVKSKEEMSKDYETLFLYIDYTHHAQMNYMIE